MKTFEPIGGANAIDNIFFVVQLARELSENEVQSLKHLSEQHNGFFAKSEPMQTVTFNAPLPNSPPQQHSTRNSGVTLTRFQASGTIEWQLKANQNLLSIACGKYTRWNEVSSQALSFLTSISALLEHADNFVMAVALQVVDRFQITDAAGYSYDIQDVFSPDSNFLTPQAKKCGGAWHVFQGWFDEVMEGPETLRLLNVLNLTNAQVGGGFNSFIDHTVQLALADRPQPLKWYLGSESGSLSITSVFNTLHERNKEVVRNALAEKQLEKIGLRNDE